MGTRQCWQATRMFSWAFAGVLRRAHDHAKFKPEFAANNTEICRSTRISLLPYRLLANPAEFFSCYFPPTTYIL